MKFTLLCLIPLAASALAADRTPFKVRQKCGKLITAVRHEAEANGENVDQRLRDLSKEHPECLDTIAKTWFGDA